MSDPRLGPLWIWMLIVFLVALRGCWKSSDRVSGPIRVLSASAFRPSHQIGAARLPHFDLDVTSQRTRCCRVCVVVAISLVTWEGGKRQLKDGAEGAMADAIDSFDSKLAELTTKLEYLRRKRTRIEEQIAETEEAVRSLHRAVEILNLPMSEAMKRAAGVVQAQSVVRPPGVLRRLLDVILDIVEPGETVRVRDLVRRIQLVPDYKFESRTPGVAVAGTLARAREHFEPVRRGVYRRRAQPGEGGQPEQRPMGQETRLTEEERGEHESEYNQLYYELHRDQIRAARKLRYESDPEYRHKVIAGALRSRARLKNVRDEALEKSDGDQSKPPSASIATAK